MKMLYVAPLVAAKVVGALLASPFGAALVAVAVAVFDK
jgi:hypothetical protein